MSRKIRRSDINHLLNFFRFSKTPVRSIIATLLIGVSIGVAYEEFFGIGTWHSFHANTDKINICFTPPSGCESLIAQELSKADNSIHMQAYGLTSTPIINQLKLAKKRGVSVSVILDGGNLSNNKSIFSDLKNSNITTYIDKMPGIAHNKVIIIDKKKTITGSFNFTKAANTKNAENVLLIDDKNIAKQYLLNWLSRKNNATL